MTSTPLAARVLCIATPIERAEAVEALVRVLLPEVQFSHRPSVTSGAVALGPDIVLVDAASVSAHEGTPAAEGEAAAPAVLEAVRRIRAAGFAGPLVILSDPGMPTDQATGTSEIARLGGVTVTAARLPAALTDALLSALEARRCDPHVAPVIAQLGRTRQVLAAGEIALSLQHALNNPLAAILAESQLLEMDPLPDDQRQAVGRIVALCRRMIATVRRLDGVGGAQGGAGRPPSAT